MNVEGPFSNGASSCGRCGSAFEADDNFCRQCGLSLHDGRLPSVRESAVPDVWRPSLPAVVARGAAVIVAGTLAEFVARRLASAAFGRGRRRETAAPVKQEETRVVERDEPLDDDTQMVSETLLLRRVRFRR